MTSREYNALSPATHNAGSAYQHRQHLSEWKNEWAVFAAVHSVAEEVE